MALACRSEHTCHVAAQVAPRWRDWPRGNSRDGGRNRPRLSGVAAGQLARLASSPPEINHPRRVGLRDNGRPRATAVMVKRDKRVNRVTRELKGARTDFAARPAIGSRAAAMSGCVCDKRDMLEYQHRANAGGAECRRKVDLPWKIRTRRRIRITPGCWCSSGSAWQPPGSPMRRTGMTWSEQAPLRACAGAGPA